MHRSEEQTLCRCADCGAEFAAGGQAGYSFDTSSTLCFECAMRRGGSYDADRDHWSVAPQLDGLQRDDPEAGVHPRGQPSGALARPRGCTAAPGLAGP